MFFKNDALCFRLLDVLHLDQKNVEMHNSKRNFNALSFRFRADTVFQTEGASYFLQDHFLSFVPAGLDYSRFAKYDELIVVHFEVTDCDAGEIECFLPREPEAFGKLFTRLLTCWEEKSVGYQYKCSAIFNEILALCYAENYKPTATDSKIQRSVSFMLAHYRDCNLTIGEIAAKSFVSQVYFRRLFKKEYGVSPQKYIIRLRMQYAKELISAGYYSLKEIAFLCGYTDYKYFSCEFRKYAGVSPSEYVYNYQPE